MQLIGNGGRGFDAGGSGLAVSAVVDQNESAHAI
jgi:hypothetical protein